MHARLAARHRTANSHPATTTTQHTATTSSCIAARAALGPTPTPSATSSSPLLQQTADSWGLEFAASYPPPQPRPVVLVVDGTNIGCISAAQRSNSSPASRLFRQTTEGSSVRFRAWLQFLATVANSATSTSTNTGSFAAGGGLLAAVLVAFDNKGSAATNVRAQLLPSYLTSRYSNNNTTGGTQQNTLSGWSELAGVVEQLDSHQQLLQQQQQHADASAGAAPSFLVAHAAYGFEADDVIAAAAQWCRTPQQQLDPAPLCVIASSDSDMQQLLVDDSIYWLELQQVASAQHPSGLVLHSAASFRQEHGFEPAAYPHYLALTGKKEASISGVGMSAKLARTLLARFGSLDGILASRHALKPFGAAHKLLGQDQPGADARCATATANLAVLRMRPEQQKLLVGRLQESYSQAVARMGQGGSSAQLPSLPRQHQQQPQQQDSLSLLHPARRLHVKQCEPFLATLQECLLQLGWSQQHPNWTGPSGLWCDLVVCAPLEAPSTAAGAAGGAEGGGGGDAAAAAAAAGDDAGGVGQTSSSSTRSSSRSGSSSRLAFQILGPADLSAGGGDMLPLVAGSYESAVNALAQQLAASCGSFAEGNSALGHPRRSLLRVASGGAKRQLTLLRGLGMPLVAVPFYELVDKQEEEAPGLVLKYVQAVLKEHSV